MSHVLHTFLPQPLGCNQARATRSDYAKELTLTAHWKKHRKQLLYLTFLRVFCFNLSISGICLHCIHTCFHSANADEHWFSNGLWKHGSKKSKKFFYERTDDKSVRSKHKSELLTQKSELLPRNSQLISQKSELRRTISNLASTRTAFCLCESGFC